MNGSLPAAGHREHVVADPPERDADVEPRLGEIAARQLHALRQHYTGKLRLSDVKEMFGQMRDHA